MKATLAGLLALLVAVPTATASPSDNSFQPPHVYFHEVHVGQHPFKYLVYHNGTGKHRRIRWMDIAGSGSQFPDSRGVFKYVPRLSSCKIDKVIPAGGRCALAVRIWNSGGRTGWFRSSANMRLGFKGHIYASAELRVHLVP